MIRFLVPPAILCAVLLALGLTPGNLGAGTESGPPPMGPGIEAVQAIVSAPAGVARARAVASQGLFDNRVEEAFALRQALIQDSFVDNQGIVSVNQDVGNINHQANIRVLLLLAGESSPQDQPLVFTSARRTGNTLISRGGVREDRITNSFADGAGIVGANQSAGSLNQQANVFVLVVGLDLGPQVAPIVDDGLGEVAAENSQKREGPLTRLTDSLTDSFFGFRGMAQVSQSAGDFNIIRNTLGVSVVNGR